jgi:hypothetical protein
LAATDVARAGIAKSPLHNIISGLEGTASAFNRLPGGEQVGLEVEHIAADHVQPAAQAARRAIVAEAIAPERPSAMLPPSAPVRGFRSRLANLSTLSFWLPWNESARGSTNCDCHPRVAFEH